MVHTFTIYCIISAKLAQQILRHLDVRQNSCLLEGKSKSIGLSDISIAPRGLEYDYWLKVKVDPAKLLEGYKAYRTVEVCEFANITQAFARAARVAFGCDVLPSLPEWFVNRIDYAIDINTAYVDRYLQLFDKADRSHWYKELHNSKQGSCYWICESANVNHYNKADRLQAQSYSQEIVDSARNTLRFEIQCKSPKIAKMKEHYNFDGRQLSNFFCRELAADILQGYCRRVFKTGDYYSLSEALKRIKIMVKATRSQNALKDMLTAIAQARSISEARNQLADGIKVKNTVTDKEVKCGKRQFSRKLKQLADLGINPVTIPRDWRPVSNLNSIMHQIESIVQIKQPCDEIHVA